MAALYNTDVGGFTWSLPMAIEGKKAPWLIDGYVDGVEGRKNLEIGL
jgi:hypothetical protein